MRVGLGTLLATLCLAPVTLAVFADDAYHIDYHHELLGLPQSYATFFYQPRDNDKATLLYTLSDLGILGAINPGTGKIVWRQALGDGNGNGKGVFKGIEGERTVVSGYGKRVDRWDALTGISKWSIQFNGEVRDLRVLETWTENSSVKDVLVLFEENGAGIVRRLKGDSGELIWEYKHSTGDGPLRISSNLEDVYLISLLDAEGPSHVRISSLNPDTGEKNTDYLLQAKTDIHSGDDILVFGANSALPFIAWPDKAKENLRVYILTRSNALLKNIPLKLHEDKIEKVTIHVPYLLQSPPHFLVHVESKKSNKAEVYHMDAQSKSIDMAYELPELSGKGLISVNCQGTNVFFTRITPDEVISISSASHGVLGRWPIKVESHTEFLHAASEVVRKSEDSYAVRFAGLTTNETLKLVRNGVEVWDRQEGLSGAIAVEWAEIPEVESLAATLQAEAHSSPFHAYIHRVNRHVKDLRYLPGYMQNLPHRILSSIFPTRLANKSVALARDNFGFNKIVFVATVRGSVYALNSGSHGAVVWSLKAFDRSTSNQWDVKGILADNIKGIVNIRGSDGEFISIDSTSGNIIERFEPSTSSRVKRTAVVESSQGRWLLSVDENGIPNVTSNYVPEGFLVTQSKSGEVKGIKFESSDKLIPMITWTFNPKSGERVVNIISRPTHDPVASIGRVLGDRNVLYKYLNPNLVLVTAVSDLTSTASFYLLDGVSGDVLHSCTHGEVDVKQPITSALTENWFVYSLWSDTPSGLTRLPSSKGYQIVVSELFESKYVNDRGPLGSAESFSSLEPSEELSSELASIHVVSQAYLIPEPISHMTVTQTLQGITSRQLICTLAHSNAIIGIPRTLLDPRRPVGRAPTPLELEEGLFQYQPFIEFNPKMIITHEREVLGVKGVITMPALLESTSLLFAYGIDIFGTRIAPSQAFDILGKEFNKLSLVVTVAALAVSVVILAPIVRRKQINARWTSY
ncbi:hypothetical protein K3495_g4162 [Podosphaera aphanis]|nr:hypothetical protein K3495_g4162 [Podosphaera aphanis]